MSYMPLAEDDRNGLNRVLDRAGSDPEYRQLLLTDPHAAIEAVTGHRVQPDFRIRFVEKDRDLDALVVLPDAVSAEAELTEAELAAVAGGAEEAICWGTCEKTCTDTCFLTGVALVDA